jgi:hypothetical protein
MIVGKKFIHFRTQIMNSKLASMSRRSVLEKLSEETATSRYEIIYINMYMLNQMNQKEYGTTKIRIRKQSAPTMTVKPIIQSKLLGMVTIDLCNIVVHIYSLFGT